MKQKETSLSLLKIKPERSVDEIMKCKGGKEQQTNPINSQKENASVFLYSSFQHI